MIVTDHPYLTFRADRLVPPPLVESSVTRVLAGSLTPDDFIAEATRYDAQAVLLWADKITTMREVKSLDRQDVRGGPGVRRRRRGDPDALRPARAGAARDGRRWRR